jgi:hypothetical protein
MLSRTQFRYIASTYTLGMEVEYSSKMFVSLSQVHGEVT